MSAEYSVSTQQIYDIRKNKEKIMKFADNLETREGLMRKSLKIANDEQCDKALYAWFLQTSDILNALSLRLKEKIPLVFSASSGGKPAYIITKEMINYCVRLV